MISCNILCLISKVALWTPSNKGFLAGKHQHSHKGNQDRMSAGLTPSLMKFSVAKVGSTLSKTLAQSAAADITAGLSLLLSKS